MLQARLGRPSSIAVCMTAAMLAMAFLAPPRAAADVPSRQSPDGAYATDCPPAFEPYSADTNLVDLFAIPDTRAVIAAEAPRLLSLPEQYQGLMSVREGPRLPEAVVLRIADRLGAIPVTAAAAAIRCSRYDHIEPVVTVADPSVAVLVFSKTNGFRDTPSITAANAAFAELGRANGWEMVFTENGAIFTPASLARFRTVVWSSVSGDVLTLSQRAALRGWIEAGGGFVGIHGAGGDKAYAWDWYRDTLIGAAFIGHPLAPQFQAARLEIDPDAGPLAAGLPESWTLTDEWYSFASSPRAAEVRVVATLDEASYSPNGSRRLTDQTDLVMGQDHPIVWRRCVGEGRSLYSAIGHRPDIYDDPAHRKLLENALRWSMGEGGELCHDSHFLD